MALQARQPPYIRICAAVSLFCIYLAYSDSFGVALFAAAAPTAWRGQAAGASVKLVNGPIRQYWPEHHGYCGEFSVQVAAAYHGHWVSQRAARWLAGGEVLVSDREGENMLKLLHKLGLENTYWRKQPVEGDGLKRYMLWVKQQLLQGRVVVFPARIAGGTDVEYDHLMPYLGVRTSNPSEYSPHDVFVWTTGERGEVSRALTARSFFADSPEDCAYSLEEGGCISSNTPTYGAAVASLPDRHGIYLPMRLLIDSWEDGTPGFAEPRNGNVAASYSLDLRPAAGRVAWGDSITIFRFTMVRGQSISKAVPSGSALANQPSLAALQRLCAAAGGDCGSYSLKVGGAPPLLREAEDHLGELPAGSVTFFIAVKGK